MRKEKDTMGEMEVPEWALYGASTARAVRNFPISNLRFSREFIEALGIIKLAAARTNHRLKLLDDGIAKPIMEACLEVIEGKLDKHFVCDIFQTGSGTSTNMNANEVIANRAIQLLGGKLGDKSIVHPNDHVNLCQSSNDVIPTAIHVSAFCAIERGLKPALTKLCSSLERKRDQFQNIIKSGRTHLQDATPVTLGQEFGGYSMQIKMGVERIERATVALKELALGGTAVGTGLNAHPEFATLAIKEISDLTKIEFVEARDHFEAQGARDGVVEVSGQIRTIAGSLRKMANDIRWLSSGPRCSFFEISLPEIQPGSSIMPAKVNPVICESVKMATYHIAGNDATIAMAGADGDFELNVNLPVIAYNLLESILILQRVAENFADQCIDGIEANVERCKEMAELSLMSVTALVPALGYTKAAEVAKVAFKKGTSIRKVVEEEGLIEKSKLDTMLNLINMTKPGL